MTAALSTVRRILSQAWPRTIALYLAGIGTGALSGHGNLYLMPACFLFIALFRAALDSRHRWALALGYYGGFTLTMFPGAAVFFGHAFNPFGITLIWLFVSGLLAAPWALLCRPDPARLAWAVPCAIALETLPPLGLIGVGNPLNSAGVLFPHTAWFGVAVVFVLSSLPAIYPRTVLSAMILLVAACGIFVKSKPAPANWAAVNTELGGQGLDVTTALENYQAALFIQKTSLEGASSVIVFPESLVEWNTATEAFWRRSLDKLHQSHRTMILGAKIRIPGPSGDYRNVAVIRGADNSIIDQRIPIPFTMWNPLTSPSVPLNLYSSEIVTTHGQKAAVLICYEQLLSFPILESFQDKPTLLVGIANDYWAKGTYFPAIQRKNLEAWGRLFNVPVLTAVNQ